MDGYIYIYTSSCVHCSIYVGIRIGVQSCVVSAVETKGAMEETG